MRRKNKGFYGKLNQRSLYKVENNKNYINLTYNPKISLSLIINMKTKLKDLKGKKLSRSKVDVDVSGKHLLGMPSIEEEEPNNAPSTFMK